jgi:hypothetical protein
LGLKEKVEACGVLMLALEDNDRRLQRRVKVLRERGWPANFHFNTEWERGDIGEIERNLDAHPDIKLVGIDTWGKFKALPARGIKTYDYDEDVVQLSAIKRVSDDRQITIGLVHHTRKQASPDVIDEISGTAGISGTVDTIWVLKRPQGSKAGELFVNGRDIEDETYAVTWDTRLFSWRLLGKAKRVNISPERKAAMEYLISRAPDGATHSEITAALGKPGTGVANLLSALEDDGLIEKRDELWRNCPDDM